MAEPQTVKYTKLPGSGISRQGGSIIVAARVSSRLWLGDDHLLHVESTSGYAESYKRFYFRDIQAFSLHKTRNWFVGNVVLSLLTGICLVLTLAVKGTEGVVTLGIISGVFCLLLVINLFRGTTCTCHIKTAVHYEELPSLRRHRTAEKVLDRIRPLIETAQGAVPIDVLAQQYSLALSHAGVVPGVRHQSETAYVKRYQSKAHGILFALLLAMSIADVCYIFFPNVLIVLANMLITAATTVSVIAALLKQRETDLKRGVRLVTLLTAIYSGLGYLVSYVVMFLIIPANSGDTTQWGLIKALARVEPLNSPGWLWTQIASATISAVLGISGMLLIRQHWREKQQPASWTSNIASA